MRSTRSRRSGAQETGRDHDLLQRDEKNHEAGGRERRVRERARWLREKKKPPRFIFDCTHSRPLGSAQLDDMHLCANAFERLGRDGRADEQAVNLQPEVGLGKVELFDLRRDTRVCALSMPME